MNTENKIILKGVWTDNHDPYFTGEMLIMKNGQRFANSYFVDTHTEDIFNLKAYLEEGPIHIEFVHDDMSRDIAERECDD